MEQGTIPMARVQAPLMDQYVFIADTPVQFYRDIFPSPIFCFDLKILFSQAVSRLQLSQSPPQTGLDPLVVLYRISKQL